MVVVDDVAEVVTACVMGFAHAHGVVREVDIAVVAWRVRMRLWRRRSLSFARRVWELTKD